MVSCTVTPARTQSCDVTLTLRVIRVCVQVSFLWAHPGPGTDPSVPAGCLLHQTLLQGPPPPVSTLFY